MVFARTTPEHKLRIVTLLRARGEVVAVTGDGVNDAPALKRADIGIAMGLRGNDVAREAAHVVLTDDNFSSIVAAIEEGRAIHDNIRRFAAYVLNSNPQEMLPYVAWMLIPGMPLAMTVMGVLAVDVGTDLIPAMGLGIEPPEPGILNRPPRRRDEPLLSVGFILRSYLVNGLLLALSCWLTYYFCGWVLGAWRPGDPLTSMPSSPPSLDPKLASFAYLQTLTAYFFPTVTAQIANVLCKRSSRTSLFASDFLPPERRAAILSALRTWRPRSREFHFAVDLRFTRILQADAARALGSTALRLCGLPFRIAAAALLGMLVAFEPRVIRPLLGGLAHFLERHPIVLNLVANPLVDLGIAFELALCWLFFDGPLASIYGFAPAPPAVYLFAFHGTILILAFEETKKALRRRGHALEFLG
ncbi:MAG: cation-transporting P-type ATPase [Deltaproteobacteria bacterium]|nr:cation-transporting P-type ATPase [Deltaproteobacteria bacterium]